MVKRYMPVSGGNHGFARGREHKQGDYVLYSDYQKLEAERDRYKAALKNSVEIIEGILEDPEVINVYKCHVDKNDLVELKQALQEGEK